MSVVPETKINGSGFTHEPPVDEHIPEPQETLPTPKLYGPDNRTLKHPAMTQKATGWFQQNAVTIGLVAATFISTFAYMKFQIDNVLEKNAELKLVVETNKREAKQETADAQAYAISARGKADYLTGILIGKGIVKAEDVNQQK